MKTRTKRGLVVGGAALALAGGSGAALAARANLFGDNERQAFLDDAAKRLNVSPTELQNALQGAADARIDAAVKAGKLTKAQGDMLKARFKANGGLPLVAGPGGPGRPGMGPGSPGFGFGVKPGGLEETLSAAATYLGLTDAELKTQLASGKTLAQVAKAQNKSVSGLKQAMLDAATKELDAAVTAGKLTKAQETAILAGISMRLDDFIQNGAMRPDGPGFGHGPGGPGGSLHATIDAAATYLGLTEAQLRTQLESGKTLAQIAKAQGKSVSGLKQAMLDAVKKDLDAGVTAGKLTKDQATAILADVSKRLDDMIQNGGGHFDGGRHFDGRFGPPGGGPRFEFRSGGGAWTPPPTLPPAA